MTFDQAISKIISKFDDLKERGVKGDIEAVWIASSDKSENYDVDEEWVGVRKDGSLAWAYASGCSCWDGIYESSPIKDIKSFKFNHEHAPEFWKSQIVSYAKDHVIL